jgi:hypothetical protein
MLYSIFDLNYLTLDERVKKKKKIEKKIKKIIFLKKKLNYNILYFLDYLEVRVWLFFNKWISFKFLRIYDFLCEGRKDILL